jgi:Na+/melibiose symporter-like transporter
MLFPAVVIGVIMTAARIWDAFDDPFMGVIVDRTQTKRGKCIPFLRIVPIPIAIFTFLCFTSFGVYDNGDGANQTANALLIAWTSVIYFLWGVIYTIGDIPIWGLSSLLTESDTDKGKLLSGARIIGGIASTGAVFTLQPLMLAISDAIKPVAGAASERFAFMILMAIVALIGGALFQILGFVAKERVIPAPAKKPTLKQNFKTMFKNKPFRRIVISGILGSPKNLIMLVVMTIVTYYFASKNPLMAFVYMALIGGGMLIGQFVFMALTPRLALKYGKKTLYNAANFIGGVPLGLVFVLYLIFPHNLTDVLPLILLFILFTVAGCGSGITGVVQTMMIADCVDYEEQMSGIRPDGAFFSGLSFINKLAGGVATILSTLAYAIVGFEGANIEAMNAFADAGGLIREAPQFDKYMMMLFFLISIPPMVGSILAVIPTWKYPLTDKWHTAIVLELKQQRLARETTVK